MKNSFLLMLLLLFKIASSEPIKVILDTDMDSDIDDVAAMAILHHFADLGEVEILATISSSSSGTSVRVINAINTYCNRKHIPVAVPDSKAPNHSWVLQGEILAREFPNTSTVENSPTATNLYRKVLASQPDNSIILITIGYLTNLNNLLLSEACEFSPLNGVELVSKKVAAYYCMGGRYPADKAAADIVNGNFRPDPNSARYVVENWPTKIIFTAGGDFVQLFQKSGNALKRLPENNPVRMAYYLAKGDVLNDWSHHTADILTVWVAVRGAHPYFKQTTFGHNYIDKYGRNVWKTEHDNSRHIVVDRLNDGIEPEQATKLFENLFSEL